MKLLGGKVLGSDVLSNKRFYFAFFDAFTKEAFDFVDLEFVIEVVVIMVLFVFLEYELIEVELDQVMISLNFYFCDLSLLPIEYPRPNAVSTRLTTAIRPSIVIMAIIPLSYIFPMLHSIHKIFILTEGHSPLSEGLTAYRK